MDSTQLPSLSPIIFLFFLFFLILWTIYGVIYRLYLHPLAKFPGPKLAIITYWYEFYYDIILGGQYTFKLKSLHDEYGPVLRLNPDELHINDPDFYDEIFNTSNGKVEKPYKEANTWGPYPAAIGTIDHDLHRVRRGAVNPYFSKRSVNDLVPFIQKIINNLCLRFENAVATKEPLNLKYAYAALTMDIISEYCFSRNPNRVLMPAFDQKSFDDHDGFVEMSLLNAHLPWIMGAIYSLPDRVSRLISPALVDVRDERERLSKQVEAIRTEKDHSYETSSHRTIFHSLLESHLPPSEIGKERLRDEAFSLVTAGASTSSHVLKIATYHIAANPRVQKKLLHELRTVLLNPGDHVELQELEKLPYLTAIIHEGLRIAHAVSHRLSRAYPNKSLKYRDLEIPPKTVVYMTSLLIHENPDIFPEPRAFKPERWLGDDQQRLLRHLTPFSRGTRACLGINLAWAEMYLILATVFRRFSFDIKDVVRERDIDCVRDLLLGAPAPESKGVVITVSPVVD